MRHKKLVALRDALLNDYLRTKDREEKRKILLKILDADEELEMLEKSFRGRS